ncbi:MAG TPA: AMP-binding protein [Acidimicrobiales bacterium]|nr:AMP-binding protein [Acidimicrobiales bacterium]
MTPEPVATTLPALLLRNAERWPHRVAMREKDLGIWQAHTWAEYAAAVEALAHGFAALGLRPGDRVAVVGDNRPELYWACLAVQSLRALPVPLYQDAIAEELGFALGHAEVRILVAEDQEQVDKVLAVRDRLPSLEHILFDDPKGMTSYEDPILRALATVAAEGRAAADADPTWFRARVAEVAGDDVALISYTSGSTGVPKGAVLSHANLLASSGGALEQERWEPGEEGLAYLPMAWIGDTLYSLAASLSVGAVVSCPEGPATVQRDLREIGPTVMIGPPRIWENLLTEIRMRVEDADRLKRALFRRFVAVAEEIEAVRMSGARPTTRQRALHALGERLVYAPLRDQIGLGRMRYAYSGGAALGPETLRFYRGIGVNLKQVYGMTEAGGLVTVQPDNEISPTSVGRPIGGAEVKVADDGELVLRGPAVFQGYFRDPEATAATFLDGWFRTGDAGFFDERGHLVVIDRAADLAQLADGTRFAPQFIENRLKFSPYVKEAVALGSGRPHVAALVNIDGASVGRWAERRNIPYTSYADLCLRPEVHALIQTEVATVNASLQAGTEIHRFLVLHKELDPDDGEITRTRKLRRRLIADRYGDLIAALYDGADSARVSTTVTYEDGHQREIEAVIPIGSLT